MWLLPPYPQGGACAMNSARCIRRGDAECYTTPSCYKNKITVAVHLENRIRGTTSGEAPMPAYVVGLVEVTDPDRFKAYQALAPETIAAHGGRYIVRGGDPMALEGEALGPRVVVLEFPDTATAQKWYNSTGYQHAISVREGAATLRLTVVPGV